MTLTKRRLVLCSSAVVLSTVAVVGAGIHLPQTQAFLKESPKELVDEVWQVIYYNYVDATFNQVDWRQVRRQYLNKSYTNKEEAYAAIKEMLEKLEDPYTRFMNPQEYQNMQIDTSGELTGVGITISKHEETDRLVVIAPIEDSPAFKAGIMPRDIIMEIDGKNTKGMGTNEAVKLIRGTPGSRVTLTIQRGSQQRNFTIERARIQIHPVRARIERTPQGNIGYIRLNQFSAQAPKEMREAIKNLERQNVNGYILDLRSNPGGLLYASVDIARMWLDRGKIVSTVNRKGLVAAQRANNRALTDKPLVILVDGASASASEILSGALQDNNRAVLVGTQTFGKGLVQSVRPLKDGSGLAVTIAKYLTPNGKDINKEGITPDIIVDLSDADLKTLQSDRTLMGTPRDPQFAKALRIVNQEVRANRQ